MYSQGFHRLDTPPPGSQFRRPWSPDPEEPIPLSRFIHDDTPHPVERSEPSDVSVEALDLADYARTLRTRTNNNPLNSYGYDAPAFRAFDNYPPTPPPVRPLASRDSLPSLISPSASSSRSHTSSVRTPTPHRRPYSLPPPTSFPHHPLRSFNSHSSRTTRQGPTQHPDIADAQTEIDIANFPAFSRNWYDQRKQDYDPYPPQPNGQDRLDFFDPTFPTDTYRGDPRDLPSYSPPPTNYSAYGSHPSRDAEMLPWSADPPDNNPPLDAQVKEERVRMLEREFGKGKGRALEDAQPVGSVDSRGRLITQGPKKRLAIRCLQVLLALLAGGSSIYAAAVIKTSSTPPPSGKPPAYVLYVLSVITFLFATYFFLIFPACCGPRKGKDTPFTQGPSGMMVLPVQGLPGGKKAKKSKKKGEGGPGDGVQVNLIVDPGLFGGRGREEEEDEEADYGSGSEMPGSYTSLSNSSGQRKGKHRGRAAKRRGLFEGLALEAQWKRARKLLKWSMAVDVVGVVLWGGEFVLIMMGKRCIPGAFNGWCDAYNLATAAACLLCFAFGFSVFFDVKDLHTSRVSPRTRT